MKNAWMAEGHRCGDCGWPVVVAGSNFDYYDYQWYCANKLCPRHRLSDKIENNHTGDQVEPYWVVPIPEEVKKPDPDTTTIGDILLKDLQDQIAKDIDKIDTEIDKKIADLIITQARGGIKP